MLGLIFFVSLLSIIKVATASQSCSATAACSGLVGNCCPTDTGVDLSCCNATDVASDAACASNPTCSALGLTGLCCPSEEGVLLECCDGIETPAPQCSAHAACSGLIGNCCPTIDGQFLDCCESVTVETIPVCSEYEACNALGLTGVCCPTEEGVYLECCDGLEEPVSQCSAYAACNGLIGDCCPTIDGTYLDCCDSPVDTDERMCSANENCTALEGNCCPTDFGQTLDCCNSAVPEQTPSPGQSCSDNSECAALGLEGNCCPTNVDNVLLECCDEISLSQDVFLGENGITKVVEQEATDAETNVIRSSRAATKSIIDVVLLPVLLMYFYL